MKFLIRFSLALGLVGTVTTSALHAQGSSLETRALKENVNRLQSQLEDLMLLYKELKKEVDLLWSVIRKVRLEEYKFEIEWRSCILYAVFWLKKKKVYFDWKKKIL